MDPQNLIRIHLNAQLHTRKLSHNPFCYVVLKRGKRVKESEFPTSRASFSRAPHNAEIWSTTFPQKITHKRVLKDCHEEFKVFLTAMATLGEKLGPWLFQFGKFDRTIFQSLDDFLGRLDPFLKRLPKEHKFAVEIRNKDWLVPKPADVLREHGVALALIDQGWMPRPWEIKEKIRSIYL